MEAGRGGGGEAEAACCPSQQARKLLPPAALLTLPGACARPQHHQGPGVGSALQPGLRAAVLLPLGKGGWRMGVVRFVLAAYFGEEEEEVAVQSWSWDTEKAAGPARGGSAPRALVRGVVDALPQPQRRVWR